MTAATFFHSLPFLSLPFPCGIGTQLVAERLHDWLRSRRIAHTALKVGGAGRLEGCGLLIRWCFFQFGNAPYSRRFTL